MFPLASLPSIRAAPTARSRSAWRDRATHRRPRSSPRRSARAACTRRHPVCTALRRATARGRFRPISRRCRSARRPNTTRNPCRRGRTARRMPRSRWSRNARPRRTTIPGTSRIRARIGGADRTWLRLRWPLRRTSRHPASRIPNSSARTCKDTARSRCTVHRDPRTECTARSDRNSCPTSSRCSPRMGNRWREAPSNSPRQSSRARCKSRSYIGPPARMTRRPVDGRRPSRRHRARGDRTEVHSRDRQDWTRTARRLRACAPCRRLPGRNRSRSRFALGRLPPCRRRARAATRNRLRVSCSRQMRMRRTLRSSAGSKG